MNANNGPIRGGIVALITPMLDDGSVDYPALRKLIDRACEGTDCVGVVGTTGESPTVSVAEHCEIIRVAVEQAGGRAHHGRLRCQLYSRGHRTGQIRQEGQRRLPVAVVPYYNKPTRRPIPTLQGHCRGGGLACHPANVPGRAVADRQHDTVLRLAQVPGIVGIKGSWAISSGRSG